VGKAVALLVLLAAIGCRRRASSPQGELARGLSERAQTEFAVAARDYAASVDIWASLPDPADRPALQSSLEALADPVEHLPRPGSVATTEAAKLIRDDATKLGLSGTTADSDLARIKHALETAGETIALVHATPQARQFQAAAALLEPRAPIETQRDALRVAMQAGAEALRSL
jgi:hypothetical protein